jgi:hypothetical protein
MRWPKPKPAASLRWLAVGAAAAVVAYIALGLISRPGDPKLVADDPRYTACGISIPQAWMAFPMAETRDFSLHFPGWSEGAQELLVAEPALVVLGNGHHSARGGGDLYYDMCIAVGPPGDAIIHRYGPTRFDAVRPVLDGPQVAMP